MIGKFTEWLNENTDILDEANFKVDLNKTNEYDHNSTTYFELTYLEKIKERLLADKPIYLDVPKNVTKDKVESPDSEYPKLTIHNFNKTKLKAAKTYEEFCDSFTRPILGLTKDNFMSHVWKGSFSNRGNSSSKGGVLENIFTTNFNKYLVDPKSVDKKLADAYNKIIKIIGLTDKSKWEAVNIGNNRSKRLNNLYTNLENLQDITKLDFEETEHNIGRTVADVILKNKKNTNEFYISLKYGNTNEIVNFGAAKIRIALQNYYDQYIKNLKNKKKTEPGNFLKNYCSVFGLDLKKMLMSFDYVSNNKQPKLDITKNYMDKPNNTTQTGVISTQLSKLIAYCIGCGYIYVHDTGKEIEVIDLRTIEDLAKIIKKYSGNYEIKYACDTGSKTVFDFNLCNEKDKKDIFIPQSRFELRPNQGGNINLFSLKLNINGEEIG